MQLIKQMGFQVLTAASMKMVLFWCVALSSLVKIDQFFRGCHGAQHQAMKTHRSDDRGCKYR
jgi:hypothetical protein